MSISQMSVIWDLFKTFPNARCLGTYPDNRFLAFQNKYLNILGSFCYEVKWNMHQLHTVKA